MATSAIEEGSPAPGPIAPHQPELDSSLEPASAPSEAKEEEEKEEGGGSSTLRQENAKGQRVDPEWVEERFRIDRKKLEAMLYGESYGETGEEFFERVMKETHTQVKWPSKLKIGAKSKKDPHVKVEGKKGDVQKAKNKILEVLESRVNKVTLKMDVAYTEHSHVIGKGGGNIKKVMEVTSCHIHFPDSNRHNTTGEKSNQVSISGPIDGVEEARRRIRDLQPLSLTFDLPVSLVPQALPDVGSPIIQQVVQTLGVSVSFRAASPQPQATPAFYGSCCTVWGLQGHAAAVKKATCVLMDLLLGSDAGGGLVSSQLDVTSQQHLFLLGQNGAHFLSVMHQTHTQIILPDLSAPQSPSSLLIQGSPEGVCLARQQLMDCLPVCLMFDMREDGEADPCKLAQMMQNLGVFISIKPKVKQTSKSVVVKGLERNISCLYEARRLLLRLDSCETAQLSEVTSDPVLHGGGLTSYWLNMLLQQLRISEQGPSPVLTSELLTLGPKPRPSPPPGLTSGPEEGRAGLKGADSRPLDKDMISSFISAMQRKPVVTEVRTPTDTWSGLGFSKSMPAEAVKELRNISRRTYKPYLNSSNQTGAASYMSAGGYFEGLCSSRRASTCSQRSPSPNMADDLPELLNQLGLIKYIDVFEQQEIDYQTFLTLSDEDLKEVGVSTFGARRKMLIAITDLNKNNRRLSDTPAVKPGYLEGGASGRLPRILDVDDATQSNRW
uniref:Protein bicaudal C homolog 1-like n=1 Tax=Gouania willdenowi TaxID=441366 RepID=A0A8C5DNU3_GOUWI